MAFATLFDSLYCPEEHIDLFHEPAEDDWPPEQGEQQQAAAAAALDDELPQLFEELRGKEEVVVLAEAEAEAEEGDACGCVAGREAAVAWAARAAAKLGFSALTAALATAYLDRCFLGGALRLGPRSWMTRLAAVACVALAAKVEETRVPVLLDLQLLAADCGDSCVFEAKTVSRMELLVLSALGWRMHPVTPFSYLHPVLAAARMHHCETALLAVMADSRWPRYPPSAWAAAALLATASFGSDDGDTELLALINAPKDEVAECARILAERATAGFMGFMVDGGDNKRKRAAASPPLSPSDVIGAAAYISCESSSSSADLRSWPWSSSVSVSSSPEPAGRPFKRAATAAALQLPPDEESRDAWT